MRLGIDFLRILVDSGGQVGAMRPPDKTPQLGAQGPEAAQETPKTAPRYDFDGFLEAKWKPFGTKIKSKIDIYSECQKPTKRQPARF